jgi:hypothetical protein
MKYIQSTSTKVSEYRRSTFGINSTRLKVKLESEQRNSQFKNVAVLAVREQVMRETYGLEICEVTREWGKLHIEELNDCRPRYILQKSKLM